MTTTNQGMSFVEIKKIIAQRVANAIKTIAIYETKTRMARESMSQTKQQKDKVAENVKNKKKSKGDHIGSPSQEQNKEHKVFRAHSVGPSNKKDYDRNLPLCNKGKFHHNARALKSAQTTFRNGWILLHLVSNNELFEARVRDDILLLKYTVKEIPPEKSSIVNMNTVDYNLKKL
uniref:Uncharacterized protein n=1 Tax=Tanacetum cinerariifolium TaxID=118510 RepID=A0A6L2JT85_TANCI|nr:hypothetical protein [Tanacetum cinerariifolium]GEU40239.1 hypothetical protein [Tanacetum cinerariifolium]